MVFLWGSGISLVMASLTSFHTLSFFPDLSLAAKSTEAWTMTHVLGEGCKCSQQVYKYLLERGPQKDVAENVVILGSMKEEEGRLAARGFKVLHRDAREIASEKAVGVPFLLITSPRGEAVYAGGYTSHTIKEKTPLYDLKILASLQGGKPSEEFPIFGCAVSQRIQSLMDPFSFKYKESAQ